MAHNVFTFVPCFGNIIKTPTFLTTHAIMQELHSKGVATGISALSFPDIAELRNMVLTIFYDTMPNATHLLFIDADMSFDPKLVTDCLLFDEPLVGAIYPQRKVPLSWAGSGTGQPQTVRRAGFMQVEGVGFGCTLIRRDLVTKMLEKMPDLVDTRLHLHPAGDTLRQAGANRMIRAFEKMDIPDRGLISEDLSFCIRWRQCGGEVWANINYKMSHVGDFDYSARYLDMVENAEREQAMMLAKQREQQAQVTQAPAAEVFPYPDPPPITLALEDIKAQGPVLSIVPTTIVPADKAGYVEPFAKGTPKKRGRPRFVEIAATPAPPNKVPHLAKRRRKELTNAEIEAQKFRL